ncbi:hypothetical protein FQN54_003458 [Arachnomyces sp. PD_36]|nr:hypothetical protein FQN54_003458 [Arachnomyces sp. PD_36]
MAATSEIAISKYDEHKNNAYSASASFVPQLTQTVLRYLDPKPTEKILDVGCGDGKFTANFLPSVQSVLGIDASPSMIETANKLCGGGGNSKADFRVVDCRYLEQEREIVNGTWDKVISNAALHWILRDESTRLSTLQAIHDSLKPNGTFVFEMGGHGNVAEVVATLLAVITRHGKNVTLAQARASSPWFFPSENWMRNALEKVGFQNIEKLEVEYRPTMLTDEQNGSGGAAGWLRLMGAQMLDILESEDARDAAVKEACEILETVITREEDGSKWFGYVRLRGVARKSS